MTSFLRSLGRACRISILLGACVGTASAAEPSVTLGGFGTLGAAALSNDDVQYRRSIDQGDGASGSGLNYDLDTVLGAQANLILSDRVETVIQAVTRQGAKGGWDPYINWAYLHISPTENLDLRFGRLGMDLLLFSDTRLVGFSYLPIRPAPEVLGLTSIDYLDGADLRYRHPLGGGIATLKLYVGSSRGKFSRDGDRFEQAKALFDAVVGEYAIGGLQIRGWLGRARLIDDGSLEQLLSELRSTGIPYANALADQLQLRDSTYRYAALGCVYSDGPVQIESSVVRVGTGEQNPVLPTLHGFYATAGYRTGALTPYLGFARARSTPHDPLRDSSGSPISAALLNIAQTTVLSNVQVDQKTLTLGVRYNLADDMDIKFQLDRVRAGNTRLVHDLAHPAQDPPDFTLFSAALDFVF